MSKPKTRAGKYPWATATVSIPVVLDTVSKNNCGPNRPWPAVLEICNPTGRRSLETVTGPSAAAVKRAATRILLTAIEQQHARSRNFRRLVLATQQGAVLIVSFDTTWGYAIVGPERRHVASCGFAPDTTEEQAFAEARKHATDNFGGIVWEQQF